MRKIEIVTAAADCGRDAGKQFQIKEWSAEKADDWATHMILAITRGSKPLAFPIESLLGRGMEAIFVIGIQTILSASVSTEEVVPLFSELLGCVQIIRDPANIDKESGHPLATPIVTENDIEEVKTRWWLRSEVLRVHTGFSVSEMFSTLLSSIMTQSQG